MSLPLRHGLKILPVHQIENRIKRGGAAFLKQHFTPAEQKYCNTKRYPYEHYAARYAAKAAVQQALGVPMGFHEIEIARKASGRPFVILKPASQSLSNATSQPKIEISIAHERKWAMAAALVSEVCGRRLIVNADDLNLTRGVTRAILDCYDRGIVSSATILINLPLNRSTLSQIKQRAGLGLGLHLNLTLGRPVSPEGKIRGLLQPNGDFKKRREQLRGKAKRHEVLREWTAQIELFKKTFGKLPTHLDTHHQLHDQRFYWQALLELAAQYQLPIRRSRFKTPAPNQVTVADHFYGDLDPSRYWRKNNLMKCLNQLPSGLSEIMCHPGYVDADLKALSSFTSGRNVERRLFSSPALRGVLRQRGITLTHYGLCYTSKQNKGS